MGKRGLIGFLALAVAGLALAAAGCGGGGSSSSSGGGGATGGSAATGAAAGGGATTESSGGGNASGVTALPSSSCTPVEYKGSGTPSMLIVSDLPLQGSSRFQTEQMVGAIRYVLQQQSFKAGNYDVAYQSCDDATAQAAKWDPGKCSQNANAYAQDQSVIAVIGTFNSGCAQVEAPVLNQAAGSSIAMVSPANTYVCLTVGGPGCASTEPAKYFPSGTRSYARVVANDIYQGAADAEIMQGQGVTKVYILNDKESYGLGVAQRFQGAAKALGIQVVGFEAWDPKASSYQALMEKIKASGANGIFLGGLIDENGAKLIKDKVAVLGPNATTGSEGVVLMGPDGFTTQATIDESGGAAKGMFLSVAGVPINEFKGTAQTFIDGFKQTLGGKDVDPYAIYGAQAAQLVLDAIAKSDGSRASVIKNVFSTKIENGLLGSFIIDENGDPANASGAVLGFTIYQASNKLDTFKVVSPGEKAIAGAKG